MTKIHPIASFSQLRNAQTNFRKDAMKKMKKEKLIQVLVDPPARQVWLVFDGLGYKH